MTNSSIKILNDLSTVKLAEMAENPAIYTEFMKFQGRVFKQNHYARNYKPLSMSLHLNKGRSSSKL